MVSRILSTGFLAVLSIAAFISEATWARRSDDHVFAVLGIVVAALAVGNWFAWETIREGWDYGRAAERDGAKLPALAWSGPLYIKSIFNVLRAGDPGRPDAANDGTDRRA
jgi:hypothetical protein